MLQTANGFAAFKIVAIPDTQRMSKYDYPEEMKGQTEWITNNIVTENIAFVTHLGDVVNEGYDIDQWDNATPALDLLDGVVPYSVCIGNHDYHNKTNRLEGAEEYIDRFGSSRYSDYSWYKGSKRELNHYQIFNADGRDWLHLNLEYQPDREALLWAQRVLDDNPTLPVIFSTHAFLNKAGVLGSNPDSSQWGAMSNGGAAQWYQFVMHNDQIILTLNGHYFEGSDGVAHTNMLNSFGHEVFMMCIDYQGVADDDAHFRILEFDSASDEINATSYDPNTDDYLTDAENQFTLSMDFSERLTNFSARETFATIQAANFTVEENDLNNLSNSVTITKSSGTADISAVPAGTTTYTDSSNGDYFLQVGSRIEDDCLGGVMIASVAENGRTSLDGTNYFHIVETTIFGHGQYMVATATTANDDAYSGYTGGAERDVNVAVAYFPFDQGWTAARVETYNDNTTSWSLVGSENIELGVELTQLAQGDIDTNLLQRAGGSEAPYWSNPETYRGIWNLEIPGVNSILDGVLLVCGGKNEDNYAAASPWEDGSGWQISLHDSSSSGSTESDPWNFVYVPYNTENIVAGRLKGSEPCFVAGTSGFTAVQDGTGVVRLDIEGYTPADGALIVSTENGWYGCDDFTTYEAEEDHWNIQTRDLPGATLGSAAYAQFVFVFIPFESAPSEPGGTPDYSIDYGNSVHWNGTGDWLSFGTWTETDDYGSDWGIPGWVVDNPLNTNSSTDLEWNLGYAHIDSGTVNVTSNSKPDGVVNILHMGSNQGDTTLNISDDLTVGYKVYMGYEGLAGETATINQTAGYVSMGNDDDDRTYFGRGFGQNVYNLSGGTLVTPGAWDNFGNSTAAGSVDGASTFTFNQTGGTYTDTGTSELIIASAAQATGVVNVVGGTFQANATTRTRVGNSGTAIINIDGTGVFESSSTYFDLGYYSGSVGTMVLSNGTLNFTGTFFRPGYAGTGTFTQLGGTSTVAGLVIGSSAGSTGTFNLSGGSCTVTGAANTRVSWAGDATLNVSGGSLNIETGYFYVGSTNSSSGVLNLTGGDVAVNRLGLAQYAGSTGTVSISGGSLVASNYISGYSGERVFEVVGSGATKIETDTIYFYDDHFRVKLDENGSTLVKAVGGSYNGGINLSTSLFEVDVLSDFNGSVGDTYDIMWTDGGFVTTDMVFTNLSSDATFSWDIVSKDDGEVLQLTVLTVAAEYDTWVTKYGLTGTDAASTNDYDHDGLSNLYEFGLGGNPTNALDLGYSASYEVDGLGLTFVYPKNQSADALSYYLETTDDLVSGNWTNAGYTVTGTNVDGYATGFDSVTNQISTAVKDAQFIRLIIEE
jgi:hypothetical protein